MKQKMVGDILVDLVLEDVMNGTDLFEANPNRDDHGRFSSQGAAAAYASGAMAAGRSAGILAKAAGQDREGIRSAIKGAMQKHGEYAADSRRDASARLGATGKAAKSMKAKREKNAGDAQKEYTSAGKSMSNTYEKLHKEAGKQIAPAHSPMAERWVRNHPEFKAARARFDAAAKGIGVK